MTIIRRTKKALEPGSGSAPTPATTPMESRQDQARLTSANEAIQTERENQSPFSAPSHRSRFRNRTLTNQSKQNAQNTDLDIQGRLNALKDLALTNKKSARKNAEDLILSSSFNIHTQGVAGAIAITDALDSMGFDSLSKQYSTMQLENLNNTEELIGYLNCLYGSLLYCRPSS